MYSFGVVVLKAFASDLPPAQDASEVVIPYFSIQAEDPVLADFLKTALSKDPKDRPEASKLLGHPFFQTQVLTDAVKAKQEADALATVRERGCVVCSDNFDVGEGVECESDDTKHFVCSSCFTGFVRSKVDDDAFRMLVAKGGAIYCPAFQCSAPSIKPKLIAEHVSEAVFEEYTSALQKMEEQKINATLGESILSVIARLNSNFSARAHAHASFALPRERLRAPAHSGGEGVGRAE